MHSANNGKIRRILSMADSLIAKSCWRQVSMVLLALALAASPIMQSAGVAKALTRAGVANSQLLLPLATDLRPIGHEYGATSDLMPASTSMVLTERFVLAGPSHRAFDAPAPAVGCFFVVERDDGARANYNLIAAPRSPPRA